MEAFGDEHSTALLGSEWLVKVHPEESKPYLLKFAAMEGGKYCMMATDTLQVWAEVLTPAQFARRWTICNVDMPVDSSNAAAFHAAQKLLSTSHSLNAFADLGFEVSWSSTTCDLELKLDHDSENGSARWTWWWQMFDIGPKLSAKILSEHLITPLITTMHLSFHSMEPLNELPERTLQEAIDKMTRTARRSMDTHIKHAISKPRAVSTLRRITQMLNALGEISPIVSELEEVSLAPHDCLKRAPPFEASASIRPGLLDDPGSPLVAHATRPKSPQSVHPETSSPVPRPRGKLVRRAARSVSPSQALGPGLTTSKVAISPAVETTLESSAEPDVQAALNAVTIRDGMDIDMKDAALGSDTEDSDAEVGATAAHQPATGTTSPRPSVSAIQPIGRVSAHVNTPDSDSSPVRPAKKAKQASPLSDEDSETERRRHVAKMVASSKRGGARQPIKRGGKRF